MRRFPVFPSNSRLKTIWNMIVIISVLAFSFVFSYRHTFQVYKCDRFYWICIIIFFIDMLIDFNTTVKVEHVASTDRKTIAAKYLKSWFIVDFIIAFPFEYFLLLFIGLPDEQTGRTMYFFLLQAITLTRLLKVKKITNELRQNLRINPGVMRLMVFAFWFMQAVHYISLGWIVIGAADLTRIQSDQYIRALYWAVTTVATIGYGDYYPDHDNNLHIIYTIVVQIFGVGMYGYIIGNVSGLIANLDVARADFIKKIESVKVYLDNKKIPKDLQEKILSYYRYLWDKKKNVSDENPLSDLPTSLSLEIMLYLNRDMLMKVDLFKNSQELFVREAIQMLKPLIYLPEDYIIRQGEYGDCMYFLNSGEIEVLVNESQVAKLGPGATFGETSLLVGEKRNASIHTLTHCEVYRLSKSDFDSLRSRFPEFNDEMEDLSRQRGIERKK